MVISINDNLVNTDNFVSISPIQNEILIDFGQVYLRYYFTIWMFNKENIIVSDIINIPELSGGYYGENIREDISSVSHRNELKKIEDEHKNTISKYYDKPYNNNMINLKNTIANIWNDNSKHKIPTFKTKNKTEPWKTMI